MIQREPIYAALFKRMSKIPGIVTASRLLQLWSDVPAAQQPALFMAQPGETPEQKFGVPTKWTLSASFYLYVNTASNVGTLPATVLNNLLDAIEAALVPDDPDGCRCTLGGLVSHCWISGKIETDEGALGSQAVAIIPVEMLAA